MRAPSGSSQRSGAERSDPDEAPRANRIRGRAAVAVVGLVALGMRWWQPGEVLVTTDEFNWVLRSERFATAIRTGDLAAASADPVTTIATRPGLTTLWIGFLAEKLAVPVGTVSSWLHLGDGPSRLRLAHLLMALVCTMGRRPGGASCSPPPRALPASRRRTRSTAW